MTSIVNRLYYGCEDPLGVVPAPEDKNSTDEASEANVLPPPPGDLSLVPGKILGFEEVVCWGPPAPTSPEGAPGDGEDLLPLEYLTKRLCLC